MREWSFHATCRTGLGWNCTHGLSTDWKQFGRDGPFGAIAVFIMFFAV